MKKVKRKWGEYKVYLKGKGWWFKRIRLMDGAISYQKHSERDEIWIIYVPAGCKHQLGGTGDVFELALGKPDEKDIKRFKVNKIKYENTTDR